MYRNHPLMAPNPSLVESFARNGLGAAPSRDENRRYRAYCFRFDVALAAGANSFQDISIETRENFVIEGIQAEFRLSAAATAVAGTPLPRESSITAANNTFPTLGLIRCMISVADYNWFSAPVPLSMLTGDGRSKGFLSTLPRIAANDRMRVTIYNDTNETATNYSVKGTVLFEGYAVSIT